MRRIFSIVMLGAVWWAASAAWAASPSAKAPAAHPRTGPAAAKAAVSRAAGADAPFWQGHPDAAAFRKRNEARIAAAKADIARMLAVRGPRTVENTLQPYDDATRELDAAGAQAGLIENVHPDSVVRAAAEEITQAVSAYGTEISLNRAVYQGLSAIDLAKSDEQCREGNRRHIATLRLRLE